MEIEFVLHMKQIFIIIKIKRKIAQYYHRFIIWDKDWNVKKVSKQFKFMDAMIEFVVEWLLKMII